MTNHELRNTIDEIVADHPVIIFDDYDEAIVGVVLTPEGLRLAYDYDRFIESTIEKSADEDCTYDDALEHVHYNYISFYTENSPVFIQMLIQSPADARGLNERLGPSSADGINSRSSLLAQPLTLSERLTNALQSGNIERSLEIGSESNKEMKIE